MKSFSQAMNVTGDNKSIFFSESDISNENILVSNALKLPFREKALGDIFKTSKENWKQRL